jgi:hypothetical protein
MHATHAERPDRCGATACPNLCVESLPGCVPRTPTRLSAAASSTAEARHGRFLRARLSSGSASYSAERSLRCFSMPRQFSRRAGQLSLDRACEACTQLISFNFHILFLCTVRGTYSNQSSVAVTRSRFGRFRAVFRPNMCPAECLVLGV